MLTPLQILFLLYIQGILLGWLLANMDPINFVIAAVVLLSMGNVVKFLKDRSWF